MVVASNSTICGVSCGGILRCRVTGGTSVAIIYGRLKTKRSTAEFKAIGVGRSYEVRRFRRGPVVTESRAVSAKVCIVHEELLVSLMRRYTRRRERSFMGSVLVHCGGMGGVCNCGVRDC